MTATDQTPAPQVFRRFVIACLCVGLALFAYFGFFALVGYTDDAYIKSDLIRVAPEVSGPIAAVNVRDNQRIEAGTVLLIIVPVPCELAAAEKRDKVASAQAIVNLKTGARNSQAANIQAAEAALDLAKAESRRVTDLAGSGFASQQEFDKVRETLRSSQSMLDYAKAQAVVVDREVEAAERDVTLAQTELAIAQYNLSRTRLTSRATGYVNNFDIRAGRYASAGEALVGIVDDSQWRIIANFKEDVAASAKPGTAVWVWLDTKPWRFYSGRVESVARDIARSDVPGQLLPYVSPTTDWVRFRRRLPVTILLDTPLPHDALFMGADARVLFWR